MSVAVAVAERDRPSWYEIVAILTICAGLLVALAVYDDRAARREAARANAVLAERARPAAPRAAAPAAARAAEVDRSPGGDPLLVLLMAGAGLSMAGAGLRVLSRRSA